MPPEPPAETLLVALWADCAPLLDWDPEDALDDPVRRVAPKRLIAPPWDMVDEVTAPRLEPPSVPEPPEAAVAVPAEEEETELEGEDPLLEPPEPPDPPYPPELPPADTNVPEIVEVRELRDPMLVLRPLPPLLPRNWGASSDAYFSAAVVPVRRSVRSTLPT